ncbi:ORF6N domain-containing protein [Patescibacteria group bacterium]|nr:ORF6N domain-containing protein [Patescibacteria group bacterium]
MGIEEPVIKIRDVFVVRGQKVTPAAGAAAFYDVSPAVLMRAVARHRKKFAKEMMFYLKPGEIVGLPAGGGEFDKRLPVFTEVGVTMLSTVLRSPKAVLTHIEIIRQTIRLLKFANR